MKLKYFLMAFMATYISTVRAEGFDPDTLALSYEPQVVYTPAKTTFLFPDQFRAIVPCSCVYTRMG